MEILVLERDARAQGLIHCMRIRHVDLSREAQPVGSARASDDQTLVSVNPTTAGRGLERVVDAESPLCGVATVDRNPNSYPKRSTAVNYCRTVEYAPHKDLNSIGLG
jgi:hypothetical protein